MADIDSFQRHRPALLALAYRMLGEVARAEDIVQDAWVRWQQSDGAVENAKAYLITIVTRLCLNELESAYARREEPRSDRLPEPLHLADTGISRIEALDSLPSDYALPLRLRFLDDMPLKRIAAFMGVPLSTVKWRIHHGKKLLRAKVESTS